ncbi:galactose-1-phosphate uridylyltransferase [Angustibacter sp. Root456]|uniref:galactose-1-phosphate uridylyltransferase n=1 Tax=Angustibacter sp. Root456 TaxID=1736539 RepID=UPI000AF2E1C4|nr:galactose-1-phosphate uridylyltransferase [Angustibacter sp. Root456]
MNDQNSTSTSARVRRTLGRLYDGREILYYDDSSPYVDGGATRELHDPRPPAEPSRAGQMRYDPLSGAWVAIAAHRMDRAFMPPADECPLCPAGRGTVPSEIPADDYDVVVFENKSPSFSPRVDGNPHEVTLLDGEELWPTMPAFGRCEVLCFTSDHASTFADLSPSRARTVIEAWVDRTRELGAVDGIEQVFCFENRGREIGVTLTHPHGQIYAYPWVTPRTRRILTMAEQHRARTGGNLLRDVLEAEQRSGQRVVTRGEHWTAYVPAAARWPVEVHLAPHRDVPDLPALTDEERDELAHVYLDLLRRLDRYYPAPGHDPEAVLRLPYIAAWHQAPVHEGRDLARLHLQITSVLRAPGKLKYLAGSESGMGAWVNDATPESIAERLRAVR